MNRLHRRRAIASAAIALVLTAACNSNPGAGPPLPAPEFAELFIPDSAGAWISTPLTPAPAVLPTRGRGVRVAFRSEVDSQFRVGMRPLAGSLVDLPQNTGTPTTAEAGYFSIVSVDSQAEPALYLMYLRMPAALLTARGVNLEIVNTTLDGSRKDSSPLVAVLEARSSYTVEVTVSGNGRVTSSPPGIACGTSALNGNPLTECSAQFPPGTVSLFPNGNIEQGSVFKSWSENCPFDVQTCVLTLSGIGPLFATARFGVSGVSDVPPVCRTPPPVGGYRWIDMPACATGVLDQHPGITNPALCDDEGYYCCEPGPSTVSDPRCGVAKIRSEPDCRHHQPRGLLVQPGGCYEEDAGQ